MRVALGVCALVLCAVTVTAQAPKTPPAGAPATPAPAGRGAGPAAPTTTAIEPQGYTYDPQGRRDPFVSLVRRGADAAAAPAGARPPGLAGLTAAEVSFRGTLKGRDGFVAMVEGVDKKTYLARAGDKLLDGTVRTITADTMVILQRVNDPLSLETEREVRKVLRQTEEAK